LPPAVESTAETISAQSEMIVTYEAGAVLLPAAPESAAFVAYSSSKWTATTSTSAPRRTRQAILIGGVACLALAGVLAWWSYHKDTTYARAQGTVVRMVTGGKNRQYPEVAYTVNSREYTTHGNTSGVPEVGATVEVLYPPDNPGNGAIYDRGDLWMPPVIPAILGTLSLLLYFGESIQHVFGLRRLAA
jgi:hypothetical protein